MRIRRILRVKSAAVSPGALAFRVQLIVLTAAFAACGKTETLDRATTTQGPSASVSKRIEVIETQLHNLQKHAEVVQQDLASIESTRKELEGEFVKLRTELSITAPATATASEKVLVTETQTVSREPRPWGFMNFFLIVILVAVIIGAIVFMLKIFLGRWTGTDGPPVGDVATEHGTIRVTPEVERAMRAEREKQIRDEKIPPATSPETPPGAPPETPIDPHAS